MYALYKDYNIIGAWRTIMDLQRSRKYAALSWRSECLDVYKWKDGGRKFAFYIMYYDGDAPNYMMTENELLAHVSKWYQHEERGQLWINDIYVERDGQA
jgi:hypothetical protein